MVPFVSMAFRHFLPFASTFDQPSTERKNSLGETPVQIDSLHLFLCALTPPSRSAVNDDFLVSAGLLEAIRSLKRDFVGHEGLIKLGERKRKREGDIALSDLIGLADVENHHILRGK